MLKLTIDYPRAGREGWDRLLPSWRLALASLLTVGVAALLLGLVTFAVAWATVRVPEENEVARAQTSIVYWNDGTTEMARLGDTNRISIPLSEVPVQVQRAVLSAEDRTFYEHGGFSARGFVRAAWTNLRTGTSQGGSTVTQQFAKNAYLSSEKTYSRKIKELVLSMKLEAQMDKDEILERYLNTIFFGRGTYGIETAAEAYFGVPAEDLTLEQGAVLASIINAPGQFNPDTQRDRLKVRYRYVLDGMVDEGWLTAAQRDKALKRFPKTIQRRTSQRFAGPTGHLLAAVQKELLAKGFTEDQVESGGLRIVSTFDRKAQAAAVNAVQQYGPTTGTKGLRIGLASVEPKSGEVVALYGGADYLKDSLNNATQAIAQAGSTFKPFALVAAAEANISLNSYWPGNDGWEVNGWEVNNYADTSYGSSISLLRGTENSVNTVFVELEKKVGVAAVRDAALRAGIPEDVSGWEISNNYTFVLGTVSPHTLDVASSYATLAGRGVRATPTMIRVVRDATGEVLYKRTSTAKRTMDANTADVVNAALQSVVRNGTGRPALALGRPVAAKTGSTDEYRSAWFAGYTPQLATAVSFSKDGPDGSPISLSGTGGMPQFYGSGYPARVWTAYMQGALSGEPVVSFTTPERMPTGAGALAPPPPPAPEPAKPAKPSATPAPPASKPETAKPADGKGGKGGGRGKPSGG